MGNLNKCVTNDKNNVCRYSKVILNYVEQKCT